MWVTVSIAPIYNQRQPPSAVWDQVADINVGLKQKVYTRLWRQRYIDCDKLRSMVYIFYLYYIQFKIDSYTYN